MKINFTEFAPPERVPIKVAQAQGCALAHEGFTYELLNSMVNGVMVVNAQRQIVYASRDFSNLLDQVDLSGIIGRRPGEALNCIHAAEGPGGCGTAEACSQCGAVRGILEGLDGKTARHECRMTRIRSGMAEALDLLVSVAPFAHQGERFAILSVQDVSADKRRRAFERIFFHDVINTAGGLEGLLGLLAEEAPAHLREPMELAQKGFRDMLDQILAQKDLVAAERRELRLKAAIVQSTQLLREVAELYRSHEVCVGRTLEVDPVSDAVSFATDPVLLKRIVGNLVKNALEATPTGAKVTVGCRVVGGEILFSVHNPGFIPREVQLQLFNRSFSTKGADRGLGTYSVRLLAESYLGGRVAFATSLEEGTTFQVTLPLGGPPSPNGAD